MRREEHSQAVVAALRYAVDLRRQLATIYLLEHSDLFATRQRHVLRKSLEQEKQLEYGQCSGLSPQPNASAACRSLCE